MKKIILFLSVLLFVSIMPSIAYADDSLSSLTQSTDPNIQYYKGRILSVENITDEVDKTLTENEIKQTCEVEILSGEFKGRVYTISDTVNLTSPDNKLLKTNDLVMLSAQLTNNEQEINNIYIYDFYRTTWLLVFALAALIIFIVTTLLKSLRVVVSIVGFMAAFIFYFVPLMLRGASPILLMIPLCFIIAAINILWDLSFSVKNLIALASSVIGITIAGFLGMFSENLASLIGLGESEITMLMYSPVHTAMDFTGLTFALSMAMGLGVMISVCTSICGAMEELKLANSYVGMKEMFNYGLHVGRTVVSRNVLSIAFVAFTAVVPTWIVFAAYSTPLNQLLNMNYIATELFRVLCVILSICLTMPITAFLYSRTTRKHTLY